MNAKIFIFIFFLSFIIFNLNFVNIGQTDTVPASVLPFNILSGRGVYFDEYYDLYKKVNPDMNFFVRFNGHAITIFPLVIGLMAIPIYLPFYILMKLNGSDSISNFINSAFILEKLSASIIAALSVSLFYILMFSISKNRKTSLIFSLIFAFATQTFSISSQGLWQHGAANLLMIVSEIYLVKSIFDQNSEKKNLLLGSIFGILAFASRNSFLLYISAVFLLFFARAKKYITPFIAVFAIGVASVFIYNLFFFHYLFGDHLNQLNSLFDVKNISKSFAGLFFSPSRGVIFYTPFYIFSLASILFWKKINKEKAAFLFILNFSYLILIIALNSLWGLWWGGNSWGNRLFTDIAVPAVILSYFFYINIGNRTIKILFFSLMAYSIFIQLVGVFDYPNSYWYSYPERVDEKTERLWNFTENPILRSVVIGPDLSSGPRFLYWLTNRGKYNIYKGIERNCSFRKVEEHVFLGYRVVTITFKNNSPVDWVTVGETPPFSSLAIRQIFFEKNGSSILSPITPNNFPMVIKSGQENILKIVVVPPQSGFEKLIITPMQDNQFWTGYCRLNI